MRKSLLFAITVLPGFIITSRKTGGYTDLINSIYAAFTDFDYGSCAPDNKPLLKLGYTKLRITY